MMLAKEEGQALVRLARRVLEAYLGDDDGSVEETDSDEAPPAANVGGVFATLELDGELCGCIGYLVPDVDCRTLTRRAVIAAATSDPRFPPLRREQLPRVRISISVLAPPEPCTDLDEIRLGRDGLIVERDARRGLLLPQVAAKRGWDRERFVRETCKKAGLPEDAWKDPETVVLRFEAVELEE